MDRGPFFCVLFAFFSIDVVVYFHHLQENFLADSASLSRVAQHVGQYAHQLARPDVECVLHLFDDGPHLVLHRDHQLAELLNSLQLPYPVELRLPNACSYNNTNPGARAPILFGRSRRARSPEPLSRRMGRA